MYFRKTITEIVLKERMRGQTNTMDWFIRMSKNPQNKISMNLVTPPLFAGQNNIFVLNKEERNMCGIKLLKDIEKLQRKRKERKYLLVFDQYLQIESAVQGKL